MECLSNYFVLSRLAILKVKRVQAGERISATAWASTGCLHGIKWEIARLRRFTFIVINMLKLAEICMPLTKVPEM